MYFICFAFILCAVALEIYFRNQLVFLQASRNETPIYNYVPMCLWEVRRDMTVHFVINI